MLIIPLLLACVSEDVSNDAQCSTEEQDMFLTCIDAGCSASYTQNLSGQDACEVSGGGSVVSVEAGGECGFSSSGACYVVCSCPEGVGVQFDMNSPGGQDTDVPAVDLSSIEYTLSGIDSRLASAESSIQEMLSSLQNMNADSEEQIASVNASIAEMNARLAALENTVTDQKAQIAEDKATIATLQSNLADANSLIASLATRADGTDIAIDDMQSQIDDLQTQIDDVKSSVKASTLIVSQYDVMCYSGSTTSGYGTPLHPITWYSYLGTSVQYGCVIANIDPEDPPYVFEVTQIYDNTLTYPQYSRVDSIARYGADRPELYTAYVNWGNNIDYQYTDTEALVMSWITSSGDVVFTQAGLQYDRTVPGVETVTDIPVRVTIIHDRAYTAP